MKESWVNYKTIKNIQKEISREKARRSMAGFCIHSDDRYEMNWHHKLLCDYLDNFVERKITRLMVFMPPRHGKSELVSRKLPAYILGRNPEASVLACSYSSDLAQRMNRDVQRVIDSPAYQELFISALYGKNMRSVAHGSYLRNSDIFEIVGHRGVYRGAGVGGGITGMGGDYIIIDDPIKNREEANSLTIRDKIWDWYTSTLYTRQEKNACILITLTRWHEDDLAGRLLELMKKDPEADQWTVLKLPAVCEDEDKHPSDIRKAGEALWSSKFNEQQLRQVKATIGTYDWSALYQQRPQPVSGTIFKRIWMSRYYKMLPIGCTLIQSWDLPFKKSAASAKCAGFVLARKGAEIFIVDLVNEKMEFTESVAAIRAMTAGHPKAVAKVVEDKANGPAIISLLRKEIPGMVEFQPHGSKEDRALSVTPYFEAGNIYFPDPKAFPWVGDLINDLLRFPSGVYKDTVDALVQGILYLMDNNFNIEALL